MSTNPVGVVSTLSNLFDKAIFAGILAMLEVMLGGVNGTCLFLVLILALVDLLIGAGLAIKEHEFNSGKWLFGCFKLIFSFIIVGVAGTAEVFLGGVMINIPITTLAYGFVIFGYGISILENIAVCGVNVPIGFIKYLEKYQDSLFNNKQVGQEKKK